MKKYKITKIETQKNNPDRLSLFTEEGFLTGITKNDLLKFQLYSGSVIDENQLRQIKQQDALQSLLENAYRLLSRRVHSCFELKQKLLKKNANLATIDQVLDLLQEKGYLDDRNFSEIFLAEELRLKKSGPMLIRHKLLARGVAKPVIDEILAQYTESDQYENCRILAEKKNRALQKFESTDQRTKLGTYLRQKGHQWEIIKEVTDSFNFGEPHDYE